MLNTPIGFRGKPLGLPEWKGVIDLDCINFNPP